MNRIGVTDVHPAGQLGEPYLLRLALCLARTVQPPAVLMLTIAVRPLTQIGRADTVEKLVGAKEQAIPCNHRAGVEHATSVFEHRG
jgi:hypothetical protein